MALQGRVWDVTVRLMNAGSPVLGVLIANVVAKYRRSGEPAFSTKTLVLADWEELSDGFYALTWSESDTDTLGEFRYMLTPATTGFDMVTGTFDVDPVPLAILASPAVCVVSGNVTDIGGEPGTDSVVIFRIAKTPSVAGSSFIEGKRIQTGLDAFGNFSVALLREKKVIVEIERSGLKQSFIVPDQETANLVDVLPPITD